MNKKIAVLVILLAVLFLCTGSPVVWAQGEERTVGQTAEDESIPPMTRARVVRVLSVQDKETETSGGSMEARTQLVEVQALQGKYRGQAMIAENPLTNGLGDQFKGIVLKDGDEVLLYIEENKDGTVRAAYVGEYVRDKYLFWLAAAFILILIVIGRLKGVKAVISLVITCVAVVKLLLPMILAGFDPVLASVTVCTGIIAATLFIVSGINKKTFAAIIGTVGGVLTAGIIAQFVGTMANLTGLGDEESQMLMYIPQNIHFDFRGLLFAGIIIGALGAAMDVGMSIASTMHEIKCNTPEISKGALVRAGMNVGRDVMATMSNTLILAYAGGSLQMMLLLLAYDIPFIEIINRDMIASEVVRSLAGSIGLIFTIPITAIAAGFLGEKRVKVRQNNAVDFRF